jgi:citrate lyase subunit beta/citryl-CoA lyase
MVEDARRAKTVGCKGKFVIHPNQVGPVNDVFRPSDAEVDYAHRVVAAFDDATKNGSAAVALDGKMVDTPVWKRALKLIEVAEAVERQEAQLR